MISNKGEFVAMYGVYLQGIELLITLKWYLR